MYVYVRVSVCEQTPIERIVCTHNCAVSRNIFTSRNNLAIAHNPSIRVSHRCGHLKVRNRYSSWWAERPRMSEILPRGISWKFKSIFLSMKMLFKIIIGDNTDSLSLRTAVNRWKSRTFRKLSFKGENKEYYPSFNSSSVLYLVRILIRYLVVREIVFDESPKICLKICCSFSMKLYRILIYSVFREKWPVFVYIILNKKIKFYKLCPILDGCKNIAYQS